MRMSIYKYICSDARALYPKRGGLIRLLLNASFHAAVLVRLAQSSPRSLFWLWRNALLCKHGIDVGYGFSIGPRLRLPHPTGIVIGGGAVIGSDATIYQNVTIGSIRGGYPTIKNSVTIYSSAVVVGLITIEDNANIGALTYVSRDVERDKTYHR